MNVATLINAGTINLLVPIVELNELIVLLFAALYFFFFACTGRATPVMAALNS